MSPGPTHGNATPESTAGQDRQAWVRANFTEIFGTSAEAMEREGVNSRLYAREHRDEIRRFAQMQRRQGITVPSGRPSPGRADGNNWPDAGVPTNRRYRGRPGLRRGGTAWVGILIALLALRFLLVDSFAGRHAAFLWVLEIGGIMLVARVLLFSWLRRRRFNRRRSGRSGI